MSRLQQIELQNQLYRRDELIRQLETRIIALEEVANTALKFGQKFIDKVRDGKAVSTETYAEQYLLVSKIRQL